MICESYSVKSNFGNIQFAASEVIELMGERFKYDKVYIVIHDDNKGFNGNNPSC